MSLRRRANLRRLRGKHGGGIRRLDDLGEAESGSHAGEGGCAEKLPPVQILLNI